MDTNKDNKLVKLKVSGSTNVAHLRTATVELLQKGSTVCLDCIGVSPNYIATKTIIATRAYLSTMGLDLLFEPIYKDFEIEDPIDNAKIKTGIRWILELVE